VSFARDHEAVDPHRVILWGTSFSGGHAIHIGAEDREVAAVIAQCPFTDGLASTKATHPMAAFRVTALGFRDTMAALLQRDPVTVPLVGEGGEAALMTAPDVLAGYRALIPDELEFREDVAARIGLRIPLYRPGRKARRLRCPALFCVCEKDSVAPANATLRHVRKAPKGTVEIFPMGHFDIYQGEAFERAVELQIGFLLAEVPPS
jgi:pimeloyl-ACP methyl ester carboxylesterase